MEAWEARFETYLAEKGPAPDSAHDLGHVRRVVAAAKRIAAAERARLEVVVPAAWLHDCVKAPKGSPMRGRSSILAAREAGRLLRESGYDPAAIPAIEHAVEAHSFTAGIEARSLEARVVRDADRLDAIGAIGIARCLMLGGEMGRALYDPDDPFCRGRRPDDSAFTIDHFFSKLLGLESTMTTATGREEARARTGFLRAFLDRLADEIGAPPPPR